MSAEEAKTWKAHKVKWKNCDLCDLCTRRDKIVLARGTVPADVLLVGEAPGGSEDVLGRPFVGPAGKLLDALIEDATKAAGVSPKLLFTNLISCIPKDVHGKKTTEPPEDSIYACADRLNELVHIAKPSLLIMVGKLSQKYCPKVIDYEFDNSIDLIHPAALIRLDVSQYGLALQRTTITLRDAFVNLSEQE